MTGSALFTGVDRAVFAASYGVKLRRAGLNISFTSVERCAASLGAVGSMTVGDAYWVLRLSYVTRHTDVAVFDEVFEAVFDVLLHFEMGWMPNQPVIRERVERPDDDDDRLVGINRSSADDTSTPTALPWATLPSAGDAADDEHNTDDDDHVGVPELQPSQASDDADRSFDLLDDTELDRIGERLEQAVREWPRRRSRRRRPTAARGQISPRRTMRSALRTGGEVLTLHHDRPRDRPRPVVVLLDVSGSMESYARIYLHLIRPLALAHRAEVFAFATELSRVTPAVRSRASADVIDHMNDAVGDRFSGTRLGSALNTLLSHRTWPSSLRGSVVLICSDGWDADDPMLLERGMRRISLLAHRVVWVNPRASAEGFEPVTQGMAAAHPFCDAFLAGNTARSMADVIDAMCDDDRPDRVFTASAPEIAG